MSPEERRDDAITQIIAAGGSILTVEPLATTTDPHTVAAYRVTAGAASPEVLGALAVVEADTAIDDAGLVPWTPVEVVEHEGDGA